MSVEGLPCNRCGEPVKQQRWNLGYRMCLECGEEIARQVRHCVVPMHKSSLTVIHPDSVELLKGIGNKGGLHR